MYGPKAERVATMFISLEAGLYFRPSGAVHCRGNSCAKSWGHVLIPFQDKRHEGMSPISRMSEPVYEEKMS